MVKGREEKRMKKKKEKKKEESEMKFLLTLKSLTPTNSYIYKANRSDFKKKERQFVCPLQNFVKKIFFLTKFL